MHISKTISWLVVSGLLILSSSYFEARDIKIALMSTFWACLFKTPVYWLHEIIWAKIEVIKKPDINPDVIIEAVEEALLSE